MSLVRCVACGVWACTPLRAQRANRSKQQPATTYISRACVRRSVLVCEPAFARSTSGLRCVYGRADRFSFCFFSFFHFDWYTRTVHFSMLRFTTYATVLATVALPRIFNSKLLIFHYSFSRKRKWWIRNNEHFDSNERRRRRRIMETTRRFHTMDERNCSLNGIEVDDSGRLVNTNRINPPTDQKSDIYLLMRAFCAVVVVEFT